MVAGNEQPTTPAAAVADTRHALVDDVFAALGEAHPEVFERFGDAGRRACREDLAFHLDYLEAALAGGSPDYFGAYAAWAASVLASRGIDAGLLVETLDRFRTWVALHVDDAAAGPIVDTLAAGISAAGATPAVDPIDGAALDEAPPSALELAELLVRGDRRGVWDLIDTLGRDGQGYVDIAVRTVQPALYRIGHDWQYHRISVAQEHLATAHALHALTRTLVSSTFEPPNGRRAIVASVAGNHHALGGRIVADALALRGWDVHDLGADVPTKDLLRHVAEFRPHLLGLSLALPRHLAAARDAIARVRSASGAAAPAIVVGGRPFLGLPGLAAHLGADAWIRDALHALAEVD